MQNAEKFCITNSRRTQKLWEYGLVPMILWEITTLRQETPHRAILVSFFFLLFHFNHCLQTNKHLFSGPFFHSKCAQRIITNCTFSLIVLFWCSGCVGVFSLFVCLQIFKCDWCWCCFCTVLQLSEFFAQMVEHCETEHTYICLLRSFLCFFRSFLWTNASSHWLHLFCPFSTVRELCVSGLIWKLESVFVWIENYICPNLFCYFSTASCDCVSARTWKQLTQRRSGCSLLATCLPPTNYLYLAKLQIVFVKIPNYIR